MVSVMLISLPAMTVERNIYTIIEQRNNNSLSPLKKFYLRKIMHILSENVAKYPIIK